MFAVGHLAWSYLLRWGLARPLNVKVNIPLLIVLSLIPDADLVLGLAHRGPSHSLILYVVLFTPLLIAFRRRAVPYFAALVLHVVFCDYMSGYVMML